MSSSSLPSAGIATVDKRLAPTLRAHAGALLVCVLFLLLSSYYNVTIPLWESDNEWSHFQFVRYIATNRSLPTPSTQIPVPETGDLCQDTMTAGLTSVHQFRQPPLYYLLGATAIAGIELEPDLPITYNPHVHRPFHEGGANVAVHAETELLAYEGTVLAIHVVRTVSGLIGLIGLVATYLSGLLLFPGRRYLALAMMAVNAFIPQYVFSSAVVNNDILVGALGSWCIFLCLYYVLRKPRPAVLALAILAAGMAILAKYSGLVLIPVVGVAIAIVLIQSWHQDRSLFKTQVWQSALVVVVACLPVVLWLLRNRFLYGHFFASYADVTDRFVQDTLIAPVQVESGRLLDPLHAAQFALMTVWGLFGNDNVALPTLVVVVLQGISLLCFIGVGWVIFDKRQSSLIRTAAAIALFVVLEAWIVNFVKSAGTSEPRGRYFLPVYSVVSFLLVLGLDRLMPTRWKAGGAMLLPGFLLVLTIAIPPLLLQPTYAPPPVENSTALRANEKPLNATFGDFAELLGYSVEPQRIGLYENVQVTLVWRALKPTTNNYTVGVHLLDGVNVSHDSKTRFPGHGNFATSLWKPGDVFRDTYEVGLPLSAENSLPSIGRIKVAMYCFPKEEESYLEVQDQQGNSQGDAVYFGRLKLAASDGIDTQKPVTPLLYDFGNEIALQQFSVTPQSFPYGPELAIDMHWQAVNNPTRDYTVFIHLVDPLGNKIAGSDKPLTGDYYPSGLWEAQERITDTHRLQLPAALPSGDLTVRMGLYDPQSGARLPVHDAKGVEQANNEVLLASIRGPDYYIFVPSVLHRLSQDKSNGLVETWLNR